MRRSGWEEPSDDPPLGMDQINLVSNGAQRPYGEDDALRTSTGPWMVHSHRPLGMSPWHAQRTPLGSLNIGQQDRFQRPQDPTLEHPSTSQPRQQGALPHPHRSLDSLQSFESAAGAAPLLGASAPWSGFLRPLPHMLSSGPAEPGVSSNSDEMTAGSRVLALQPPAQVDWPTLDTHLTSPPAHHNFSDRLTSVPDQAATRTLAFLSPNSPRRPGQPNSPSSALRSHRSFLSAARPGYRNLDGFPFVNPEHRRHIHNRSRRSIASRHSMPERTRSQDDVHNVDSSAENRAPAPGLDRRGISNSSPSEETIARQVQALRGAVPSKSVASRAAIKSLETMEITSLPKGERTCSICYNDYGKASPEGVEETPLRIPCCKHVFGDHCLKKWLEDSDSCPYCRRKLDSEFKHSFEAARTFLNILRVRGVDLPEAVAEEILARLPARPFTETEFQNIYLTTARQAGRRSPPDDVDCPGQRRTRQRRSRPSSGESELQSTSRLPASIIGTGQRESAASELLFGGNFWNAPTPTDTASQVPPHQQPTRTGSVVADGAARHHRFATMTQNRVAQPLFLARMPAQSPNASLQSPAFESSFRDSNMVNPLQVARSEQHPSLRVTNLTTPSASLSLPSQASSSQRTSETSPTPFGSAGSIRPQ